MRQAPAPFFARPIINSVANKITEGFLQPNFNTNFKWLESQLETSPDGGLYLCGKDLSAADILMSFPLEAGKSRTGLSEKECPLLWAYVDRLHQREAYQKSTQIIDELGDFKKVN
jgi:glutathione S-transferase